MSEFDETPVADEAEPAPEPPKKRRGRPPKKKTARKTAKKVVVSEEAAEDQQFVGGQALPEGFENPPKGSDFHRCVDKWGKYRPTYRQLLLRRPSGNKAGTEYFNENGKKLRIAFDTWTDVPPWVISVLGDAQVTTFRRNVDAKGDFVGDVASDGPPLTVEERIPAFSYVVKPSA